MFYCRRSCCNTEPSSSSTPSFFSSATLAASISSSARRRRLTEYLRTLTADTRPSRPLIRLYTPTFSSVWRPSSTRRCATPVPSTSAGRGAATKTWYAGGSCVVSSRTALRRRRCCSAASRTVATGTPAATAMTSRFSTFSSPMRFRLTTTPTSTPPSTSPSIAVAMENVNCSSVRRQIALYKSVRSRSSSFLRIQDYYNNFLESTAVPTSNATSSDVPLPTFHHPINKK